VLGLATGETYAVDFLEFIDKRINLFA